MQRLAHPAPTANDRFKSRFSSAFWIGLILATVVHAAILLGSPTFAVALPTPNTDAPVRIVPSEPPLPQPPEEIPRPASPVISDVAAPDVTIQPNVPDPGSRVRLDPPSPGAGREEGMARRFTVFEVAPVLRNPAEVQSALRRLYPPALREAGIGGVVAVWFHIDERGRVMATELHGSSGYDAFDRAALEVAELMEFRPAQNRDRVVPVWVSLEIQFEVQ